MALHDLLQEVARIYDPTGVASAERPDCALLWGVEQLSDLPLPESCSAVGYAGKGNMARVPWIGVFHEDVNTDPKKGLYLAYLFDADRKTVTLSLQQGVSEAAKSQNYGTGRRLHDYLKERGTPYRLALPPQLARDWQDGVNLDSADLGWRPRAYEHADIAARRYDIASLPSEEVLAQHLEQAVLLLSHAAAVDRYFADVEFPTADEPTVFLAGGHTSPEGDGQGTFLPGNSEGYWVTLEGGSRRRKRDHERLLSEFAAHAAACSYEPINTSIGYRDLILRAEGSSIEWLVEAKQVPTGGHRAAVREAVAQLFEYRHAYYRLADGADPHLLAVFSAPIGAFGPYLETLGIAAVWPTGNDPGSWDGTFTAIAWGLVPNA
ncbi:MrcB family domain-containing protein [Streptomyces sp. NPDC033754]|uniref:MrcB family domain-containing protein n=1 Tax=unclassified Streptomyces TaxID=2593676 RepID=UPI0033F13FE1